MALNENDRESRKERPECWDRFDNYRKDVYTHPDGGKDLVKVYDDYTNHFKKDSVAVGYLGPANLASVASEFICDKSMRILDAASGPGMVGEELKGRGFTCIDALDPSQESLNHSKHHQSYTEHICDTLDAEHQTTIPDDHYDAVVMCGAFGIPGHVTDTCFPEIIRIIKPGGYFMFTVSELVLNEWSDRLNAAIEALTQQGLWELVEARWVMYLTSLNETAKILVLRVLKK